MSPQTFACPACGSRKTLADAQPGEKVHCTCGMSYPASPVFEVHDAEQKSPSLRWAWIAGVGVMIGIGLSAGLLVIRPKPPKPAAVVAKNGTTAETDVSQAPESATPRETPDANPTPDTTPTPSDRNPRPEKNSIPPPPPPPPPPPVASLSAVTVWDAFDLDPPAAEARFKGKVVEITARGKLAEDSFGRQYFGAVVVQRGGRKPLRLSPEEQQWESEGYPASVRCYLTPEQAAAVERAPADQNVVIRGTCSGRKNIDGAYRGYIVELTNCVIVSPK